MATFLELTQRLRREAGIASDGPLSVVAQTGEYQRLVDWVASSWNDIQISSNNWRWMVGEFNLATTPGKDRYTPAEVGIPQRFARWYPTSMRIGLNPPNDEIPLYCMSYDEFRSTYLTGPQPLSRPVAVATAPNKDLLLGYPPNDAYRVRGEYHKAPQVLVNDNDIPEMPEQFHEAILYLALMRYARFNAAAEIYEDAASNYRRIMDLLRADQLPDVTCAEPLA